MTDQLPSILETNAALPAHLKQYEGQSNDASGLITSFLKLPQLSIKGKQFTLIKDGVSTPMPPGHPMKVVILGLDPPNGCAKSFYEGAYKPGENDAPDCASADGITPDPFYTDPVSRSCTECPHNAWGSGIDSAGQTTKGKLCGDHKNLFVVAFDKLDGDVVVLRVPATSLKALSAFGAELGKHGAPMQALVTELSFTNDEHPQLEFKGVSWLEEADAKRMIDRGNSKELEGMKPSLNRGTPIATDKPSALPPGSVPSSPSSLPAPPPKTEPVKTMTDAAMTSYAEYIKAGWDDDTLVEHKLMTIA